MPTTNKARLFLAMHGGACSVREGSAMSVAFRLLETMGEVTIHKSGTPGFLDVRHKDFKPRFAVKGEL